MSDSKTLSADMYATLPDSHFGFGKQTAQSYVNDPMHVVFVASRYKFCAKMLAGMDTALEIGCGDAFGSPVVAQTVKSLICTDINEEVVRANKARCTMFKNILFEYADFRSQAWPDKVDAIYLADVIEHVYPAEEADFLSNIAASVKDHGVVLIGTPNITAAAYASERSNMGHVNLKSRRSLQDCCEAHFHNVFMFSMNDEVVHTGFSDMAHYIWALCVSPKRG